MAEAPNTTGPAGSVDSRLFYSAAVILLLVIGGGIFAYLILTKQTPSGELQKDIGRLVQVCRVEETSHRIAITAYGTTRASEQWTAIAEVSGRAVKVNPCFEPGELLPAAAPLVFIDPTDYQLAVKQFQAEALAKQHQLDELDQTEKNLKQILEPQQRQLELARAEYERQYRAFQQKAVSRSVLESAYGAYQTSLTAAVTTENSLALLPVRRALTRASLCAATAQWEQARRNLSKCEIALPFPARCASKSVELNQYVAAGEQLGMFLALEKAEVVAMVETRKMPLMFPEGIAGMKQLDLTQLDLDESFWEQIRIPVEVSWALGERRPVWYGRVARIASSLDPGTRTVPVIIEVPDPYKNVQPGVRPPLIPDVFCEVTAYGATVHHVLVIPREALRDNRVYVLKEDRSQETAGRDEGSASAEGDKDAAARRIRKGKLHIAPVAVVALEETLAVIKEAGAMIQEGKTLIEKGEALMQEGQDRGTSIEEGEAMIREGQALVERGEHGVKSGDLVVLADLFPASEQMPLRGKLVKNRARARTKIDVPESVFDDSAAGGRK